MKHKILLVAFIFLLSFSLGFSSFNANIVTGTGGNFTETDTLQTVTDRGSSTTNDLITRSIDVQGTLGISEYSGILQLNHVPAPDVTATTLSEGSGSGTLTGNRRYSITFVDEDGFESSRSINLNGNTNFNSATGVVVIDNLPVSDNPRVVARHIYNANSAIYHNRRHVVDNNIDTSVTLSTQGAVVGNYMFNAKTQGASEGYGGSIGGIITNRKGQELFRVTENGQFLLNNQRNTMIFYGKTTSVFPPYPIYILQGSNFQNNFNYGFMGFDGDTFKIGTEGRGSYSSRAVQLVSNMPGVAFNLELSRGSGHGWLNVRDGGTGVGDVRLFRLSPSTWTSSWGTNRLLSFDGTSAQSGTGGYRLLEFEWTDSATGTGLRELISMRVNGNNQFRVTSTGTADFGGAVYATDFITKSRVADFRSDSRSIDNLYNADKWLKSDGRIDYDQHYAGVSETRRIQTGSTKELQNIENCDSEKITGFCETRQEYVEIPIIEEVEIKGLSMETRVAEMEKMIWELHQETKRLQSEINTLKGVRT